MRFHLFLLALTSVFTTSLSSPEDILDIQKLTADFFFDYNSKNYKAFEIEFIAEATYDIGNGVVLSGIPNITSVFSEVVGTAVMHSSLTTQSISLSAPFDAQGAASQASATTYSIVSFLGQGADAGKAFVIYGVFKDKFVKTGDFSHYGGWKFSERVYDTLVSGL